MSEVLAIRLERALGVLRDLVSFNKRWPADTIYGEAEGRKLEAQLSAICGDAAVEVDVRTSAELAAEDRALLAAIKASPTLRAVAHERLRQIEVEGFGPEHDDKYAGIQLSAAASSYQMTADLITLHGELPPCFIPKQWPWDRKWYKPTADVFRTRVKGLALGCAEGDRLKRKEAAKAKEDSAK